MCKNTRAVIRRHAFSSALALVAGLLAASCTNVNKVYQSSPGTEGLPGGPRTAEPCEPGNVTLPIDAFDVSPTEEGGRACDVGNLLDDDGNVGAIASAGTGTHKMAGRDVNGCVGVEFGENIALSSFIMKMRPTRSACGHSCTEGGKDGCGTGWKVAIFVGPSLDRLEFLQQLSLTTPDFFEYSVSVHQSYQARYGVICREPTPATGDDIVIDSLAGRCGDPPGQGQ